MTQRIHSFALRKKVMDFMSSTSMVSLSMVMTIYALFAEDFRQWAFHPSTKGTFEILHIIAIVYFSFELVVFFFFENGYVLRCYCKCCPCIRYYPSLYMILDFLALATIIMDVVAMNLDYLSFSQVRAARMARIATRVTRIIRALRLMSHVRRILEKKPGNDEEREQEKLEQLEQQFFADDDTQDGNNIKFGTYISELLTQTVIMSCVFLAVILPVLETKEIPGEIASFDVQLNQLIEIQLSTMASCLDDSLSYCTDDAEREAQFKSFVFQVSKEAGEWYPDESDYPSSTNKIFGDLEINLIKLQISPDDVREKYFPSGITALGEAFSCNEGDEYKATKQYVGTASDPGVVKITACFDEGHYMEQSCQKQVINTICLMVILIVGVSYLNNDTTEYVVRPVKNMLKNVQKLAHDPFYLWDSPQVTGTAGAVMGSATTRFVDANESESEDDSDEEWLNLPPENEIHILQTTVMKISQLLALAFGRAGWNIIRNAVLKNNNQETISQSGSKIRGIFLFSDIRGFTEVSECLGKNIIVFVNDVASVVHETTAEFNGATNKNIGDAFLAVWTFPGSVTVRGRSVKTCVHDEEYMIDGIIPREISDMVNRALIATIKIQIRIYRSDKLNAYRVEKAIVNRYKHSFTVRLGCGLHVGWAIEGAIGSNHKIDATYLSQHVNISEILECKTKLYKVRFLITDQFVRLLPKVALDFVRPVDHVTTKELKEKGNIYTVDLPKYLKYHNQKRTSHSQSQNAERTVKEWKKNHTSSENLYETDQDLLDLREYQATIADFKDVYLEGFDAYRKGDWKMATDSFRKALELKTEDGPTSELLRFMESLDFTPPDNWSLMGRVWA